MMCSFSEDKNLSHSKRKPTKTRASGPESLRISQGYLGTEELYLDHDLKNARAGAAFLALHCPTQEEGQRIFHLLNHLAPLSMRRYSPYTIDRMV